MKRFQLVWRDFSLNYNTTHGTRPKKDNFYKESRLSELRLVVTDLNGLCKTPTWETRSWCRDFSIPRRTLSSAALPRRDAPESRDARALMTPIEISNVGNSCCVFASAMLRPRTAIPNMSQQIGFHLSRNSLWIARVTSVRVNNRVTRFRRFPAINGDRLGLTDRLIRSQTSVDARLRRFTFQLNGSQSWWHETLAASASSALPETPPDVPGNRFELTQEKLHRRVIR